MELGEYSPDAHGFIDYLFDTHGNKVRYARDADRFYVYDGARWEPSNGQHIEMKSLVQRVSRKIAVEGTGKTANIIAKLGKDSTGVTKLVNGIKNDQRFWASSADFSAKPHLLNFRDCTLDLREAIRDEGGIPDFDSGIHPHDPSDMLDSVLPVKYTPHMLWGAEGDTPLWDSLLEHLSGGNESIRENLTDALAYSLYGSNPEQYIVFLVGEPNTGKSAMLELMADFTGSLGGFGKIELVTATRGGFGEHDSLRSALRGKRFVMLGEASAKIKLDEGKLKDLTGSAWVPTRELGKEQVNSRVTWTLFAATNELPALPATMDDAVARRMWIFELPAKQISSRERDVHLAEKIIRQEKQAVVNKLAWRALELFSGARRLERCAACIEALDTYRADYDTVTEFCREYLMTDETSRVPYAELHEAYTSFCRRHSYSSETRRKFIKRISEVMHCERDSAHSTMKGISLAADAPTFMF